LYFVSRPYGIATGKSSRDDERAPGLFQPGILKDRRERNAPVSRLCAMNLRMAMDCMAWARMPTAAWSMPGRGGEQNHPVLRAEFGRRLCHGLLPVASFWRRQPVASSHDPLETGSSNDADMMVPDFDDHPLIRLLLSMAPFVVDQRERRDYSAGRLWFAALQCDAT
jgi:hypothetical protein